MVTTADQRFWNTDEDILFLGEWCKIYDQKDVWSKLNSKVLPYHWDDRNILYDDYLYLDSIYERYLDCLAKNLNELHNTNYSLNYWRIVVGPWLYYFIEILYDRYLSLKTAYESGLVTNTWICKKDTNNWIPDDFEMFQNWFCFDKYNFYLYSRIVETLNLISYEKLDVKIEPDNNIICSSSENKIKKLAKRINVIYNDFFSEGFNKIVFVDSYLSNLDIIKLQILLRQIPCLYESGNIYMNSSTLNSKLRRKIKFNSCKSEFELLLNKLIPENMLKAFIESYKSFHEMSLEVYPKDPEIIFTANAYLRTSFCFWAGYSKEKGAKVVGTQHGGHYGNGLWSASEDHQIKICDRYYSWGWEVKGEKKVIPLPTGKFNIFKCNVKPNRYGTILWIGMTVPRYSYFMYSASVGPHMLNYIEDQFKFYNFLSDQVHDIIYLRLYPYDFGWNEKNRWVDKYSNIKIMGGNMSFVESLNKSRLAICTYNATTYLETFVANFPTIVFWDPYYWELRPSAQKYFDQLREVGIFHETPESAAKMVNEIYKDPLSWWNKPEVQEAKDEFCYQFARTSDDWMKQWKNEFKKVLKEINMESK
ncbi:LIC12162 family transferase [Methanoplanus limicola]|uniref:LIC12162 family transferase n=1 Tax=Methanoplanus limicola TaxID=2315 RepID=UPI00145E5D78|nr:LIC12162 family protein [Methanoplanus limicola]